MPPSIIQKRLNTMKAKGRIIQVSKITSNRQVTIPKQIMEKLKLKVGDNILWIERNKDIIIKKAKIVVEE
jgi:AbrB family looped-hinge helix DNA binding protein